MSTATITVPTTTTARRGRLSFAGILRSEWIKLRTLRSTVWAYGVTIILSIGLSVVFGFFFSTSGPALSATDQSDVGLLAATLGLSIGQLSVAVLGVLVISGEYTTGMIRSSLTAVPGRLAVLGAKALVFATVTFVVGLVITFTSYLASAPLLARSGVTSSLADPGLALALVGGALFLVFVGLISLGIGALVRSGAGGIAITIGLLMIVPIVLLMIPAPWSQEAVNYLPSTAGAALFAPAGQATGGLGVWPSLLVLVGWTVLTVGGAAALLRLRKNT